MNDDVDFTLSAKRTIAIELEAIRNLRARIGVNFNRACRLLLSCKGRVIVSGIGKSGHIGSKIAATFASTGTPAFFIHPAEANHGDLGMITKDDVAVIISNSGQSAEVVNILPPLKRLGIPIISLSGSEQSSLSAAADVNLDISVNSEACPLDLAPTSSTTVTLVMGDALAIALLEARGFTAEDFAFSHPGGTLGKNLLIQVSDAINTRTGLPKVEKGTPLLSAIKEMSTKGLGMTTIVDSDGSLLGIFTDGDLRRFIQQGFPPDNTPIENIMTCKPLTVNQSSLAAQALRIMEQHKITTLVVEDNQHHPIGVLHMHDLLRAGVI